MADPARLIGRIAAAGARRVGWDTTGRTADEIVIDRWSIDLRGR